LIQAAIGRPDMIDSQKRKARQADDLERRRLDEALDEALANTFPASDPVSAEQPVPPAPDGDLAA
jgi:hypothetical protein